MKKLLVVLLIAALGLTACGKKEAKTEGTTKAPNQATENTNSQEAFGLQYGGAEIKIGADFSKLKDAIKEEYKYQETPSCAFQGLDRVYQYSSIKVSTNEINGVETVTEIKILDDLISIDGNISIGTKLEGDLAGYEKEQGEYRKVLGNSTLYIYVTEDGTVESIEYYYEAK